jgi:hypothetical protein
MQIVIEINQAGQMSVQSNAPPVVFMGMIEFAKSIFLAQQQKQGQPGIEVAPASLMSRLNLNGEMK